MNTELICARHPYFDLTDNKLSSAYNLLTTSIGSRLIISQDIYEQEDQQEYDLNQWQQYIDREQTK